MAAETDDMGKAYATFAPAYDFVFGRILQPGRRMAIRSMQLQPGHRVLEVGVGTGLSLPLYPLDARITGIDLSTHMLDKARERIRRQRLENVEGLMEMDASQIRFPDGSFDAVIAMYIVSVVENPERVVAEMRRVCKPGGRVLIVNHFHSESRIMAAWHALVRPIHRAVHFRSDLDFHEFTTRVGLQVEKAFRANLFGYSTVLCFRNPE